MHALVSGVFILLCTALLAAQPLRTQFTDQAAALGITARNVSGSTQEYIVETAVGGTAFFDYDSDGDVDLYVANGSRFEGFPTGQEPTNHLYRNHGDRFVDVTTAAGVGDTSWSMGCAAADYDNDGDLDLYVTNFGRNTFYQNRGDGTFEDVTEKAGGGDERWGVGCAFGDTDLDGYVDLYVANYIDFSRDYTSTVPCVWKNVDIFCGPRGLLPAGDVFYRNNGDGTLADRSEEAGIAGAKYYGYGVVFGDFDRNGWPDVFVANDSAPNNLYQNQGDGTFVDEGLSAGVAYSGDGTEQGCMGAAVGDYDNDGYFDIFVTNFEGEYNTLYKNQGGEFFLDISFVSRVAARGTPEVGWGTGFFDFDNDGDQDLFAANGHTYPQADLPHTNSSYAEPNFLYQNLGDGTFAEVSERAGPGFALVEVSRGASFADYDRDGDIDLFILNLNSTPNLLRNDGGNEGNYLQIATVGTRSNRDGIGTRIEISAQGKRQTAEVRSGTSFLSHSDLKVHFGLGTAPMVESVVLHWPSGAVQTLRDVAANQVLTVREPAD
ncbi:MAG: CRTAC1 family protein [Gemmatimonadetes bacterium]|nr:CRTAC1 family protein [Gemmatimonadota bacterium]